MDYNVINAFDKNVGFGAGLPSKDNTSITFPRE